MTIEKAYRNCVAVAVANRQVRRQISRALHSAGMEVHFVEDLVQLDGLLGETLPDLLILDCDGKDEHVQRLLDAKQKHSNIPFVLLSLELGEHRLLDLFGRNEIDNLIAKHGAVRAVCPILDERELLVTCEKVLRNDFFGIEKYVGSWGIRLHEQSVACHDDKKEALALFEEYLRRLDCSKRAIPSMVTVADELLTNAMLHGPVDEQGQPKYRDVSLLDLQLEQNEHVLFRYACDGQRLMVSAQDNFGRFDKQTLYNYLRKTFVNDKAEIEEKASGAGLGLSLSMRNIHQLIFNIRRFVRTEAIAGWYLRVQSTSEFIRVGKSFNVFFGS